MAFTKGEKITFPRGSEVRAAGTITSGPHFDDPDLGTYYKIHSGLSRHEIAARYIRRAKKEKKA